MTRVATPHPAEAGAFLVITNDKAVPDVFHHFASCHTMDDAMKLAGLLIEDKTLNVYIQVRYKITEG